MCRCTRLCIASRNVALGDCKHPEDAEPAVNITAGVTLLAVYGGIKKDCQDNLA